ncbi:MAG: hypothetical protein GX893_03755, partial [Firmicutes bacterium]|nr:hypothetical protein [Bacillota bacterium]
KVQQLLEEIKNDDYVLFLQENIKNKAIIFFLRLLVIAFIGGFAGPFFFGERSKKRLLNAGLIGLLTFAILLGVSYATFEPQAFFNPEFEGILEAAPWMFSLLEEIVFNVQTLGEQLALVADSINSLFAQVETLKPLGTAVESELKVVHVSDLHNNAAGMEFLAQVINAFDVQLVIDTGDITDFGTEIETSIAARIENFGVPYIFVPGNHDSPAVIERLQSFSQVRVLTEGMIEVLGLRIAGIADPSSQGNSMVVAAEAVLDQYAQHLQMILLAESEKPPHIIAVHHPRIAAAFLNQVPVILTGHTHQYSITEKNSSVMINAGTTGAAGIRGLQTGKETPYSLVLLHFGYREDGELYLKAADTIHINQISSSFLLERRLFSSDATSVDSG